jgi:endoglucanase
MRGMPWSRRAHGVAAAAALAALGVAVAGMILTGCESGSSSGRPAGGSTSDGGRTSEATITMFPGAAPPLHVSGNALVDAAGQHVILRGVNRSGGEYACVQGEGIWDGPMGQASVAAIKQWRIDAVRVPLNEACWNGDSYVNPAFAAANYQRAVAEYVRLLNRNGIIAILDLHWTAGAYSGPGAMCTSARASCQKPMPDRAQSVTFWRSVARTFKGNNAVIFDLFNEPFPELANGGDQAAGWQCWRAGGSACAGIDYPVVGMQALVNAIRATGASNVIMLGGMGLANDLTGWLAHEPADPDHNLAVSWHDYNVSSCNNPACWDSQVAPVAAKVPLIASEIGDMTCTAGYLDTLMRWLDSHAASYLAWAWNANFPCASGPSLITSYSGSATVPGAAFRSHLAASAKG